MANVFVEESSLESIGDALRIKFDGVSTVFFPSEMADEILKLPFSNIPSYHVEEVSRVIDKLLDLKRAIKNNVVIGTIADNHVDKSTISTMTSARHAAFALESVGSVACDFVANLGDNESGTNIDNDADYANAIYMENACRCAMTDLVAYNLVGNHDKSNYTQKLYNIIGRYNNFDDYGKTQIRGFGYKDYEDKKVRVIVLNTCDYWNSQGGNGMSYEQKDFFIRALDLSDKTNFYDWLIIVLSHIPLDFLGGDYNKSDDLKAILKAYTSGSSLSITVNSSYASEQKESPDEYATYSNGALVYDYKEINIPDIVNIHGHIHNNAYGKLTFIDDDTVLNIFRISTANSSFNGNASTDRYTSYGNYSITKEEASKIAKISNTKADTSATFYFFDLDNKIVYSIGYGADIDRTISYGSNKLCSITYNLEYVTSTNTDDSIYYNSIYRTELVAYNNFSIESVSVFMDGTDITNNSYKDGVIYIKEITGDVVITATAVYTTTAIWDISNRTAVTDFYKGATDKKEISVNNYYYGASGAGSILGKYITECVVDESNNVTFTSSEKGIGIGVPFYLEPGADYTFSAITEKDTKGRLRKVVYDADGVFVENSETYSYSGRILSLEFTAPTDPTNIVMLILDGYYTDQSNFYGSIELQKNS